MSYLDYYSYQAKARGIHNAKDIVEQAQAKAFIYNRIVLPWLKVTRDASMVDLACGHGSFLCWLREHGYSQIAGVDSSPKQVSHARSAGLQIMQDDVLEWLQKQSENSQSVLFAMDFIEHISKDDMMLFLRRAHRVLRPGGLLILRYPNGDSPFVGLNLFNDITHVWTYTSNCLNSLAEMHGYSKTFFMDEGYQATRDHRWVKVPIGNLSSFLLKILLQAVSRERIKYWNSCMWAALQK